MMEAVRTILDSAVPLVAALAVLCHLCWVGIRRSWERVAGLDRLRQSVVPLKERQRAEAEALADLTCRLEEAKGRLTAADQRVNHLQRQIDTLDKEPPVFLHILGTPGGNRRGFRAEAQYDTTVAAAARAAGKPVNPAWRYGNRVVVHALDLPSARREAEHVFPHKAGYQVFFHAPVS
ncbi:coiled-coil domain-containing protein 30 [Azospirillum sp. TSH100]|uniref:coiled-coil domain-containing protein 30 n=1 Tax=Azospirillum sp. TSH100 TaxID=652764 RepID=UPI001FFF695D|nr:coiled-coil domain-containing protein 30 [Azospirillum sp. TSH100]